MANSAVPLGPPTTQTGPPLLRVVSPANLTIHTQQQDAAAAALAKPREEEVVMDELARFIRTEWDMMRNHRNGNSGWSERLLNAQRTFNGKYTEDKLADIRRFGGSEIYARLVALKCRGATALLREVYLGPEKAWGLEPTPEPTLPDDILNTVSQLVMMELQQLQAAGQPVDINAVRDRTNDLIASAKRAARKKAKEEALLAERKLDDLLVEGGFYEALTQFLTDLPLFPFACIKGPVVRIVEDVVWQKGIAATVKKAKMFWRRISPFDIYWTPGVSSIRDAAVIERLKLTRADLNELLGLPGYKEENIRKVLDEHGRGGLHDWADTTDSERAVGESRENPTFNRSGMIDCIEYHGNVQGRALLEYGFTKAEIPDDMRDYFVQVWLIGRYVIKAQISPNPRKRHPYYITSFEKVPGTPVGNALPDILEDHQEGANATLRSLINNLSISSGPQVMIDEERISALENADELFPWKRWRFRSDPMSQQSNTVPAIGFFQPNSNAQELLGVYQAFVTMADELSAIPKYITGSDKMGGAGRTASGLAMLMGNASKILQMVASNVDHDVVKEMLQGLYDMVMLTDKTGLFRGDEAIRVRGVEVAIQRETARQRQIELLAATMNPIDTQIMGPQGRAKLLRSVSKQVGIEEDIVPSEEEMQQPPPGMPAPGAPPGPQAALPAPAGGNPPAPANMDLGVPEARAMRGMTGNAPR